MKQRTLSCKHYTILSSISVLFWQCAERLNCCRGHRTDVKVIFGTINQTTICLQFLLRHHQPHWAVDDWALENFFFSGTRMGINLPEANPLDGSCRQKQTISPTRKFLLCPIPRRGQEQLNFSIFDRCRPKLQPKIWKKYFARGNAFMVNDNSYWPRRPISEIPPSLSTWKKPDLTTAGLGEGWNTPRALVRCFLETTSGSQVIAHSGNEGREPSPDSDLKRVEFRLTTMNFKLWPLIYWTWS